jgi:transferase CAF17, mitochondrial
VSAPHPCGIYVSYGIHSRTVTSKFDSRSIDFAPGLDIRPIALALSTSAGQPNRLRGTGKLLSSIGNIGLALLRLEHVESVSRGLATFQMEVGDNGHEKQICHVVNSWPIGWPVPGVNEID